LGAFNTGVTLNGRALTTFGSLTTNAVTTTMVSTCTPTVIDPATGLNKTITIYPNPFSHSINIMVNDLSQIKNCEVRIYNILGEQVNHTIITKTSTTIGTGNLPSGIYFYKVNGNNKTIQSGKLVSSK